MFSFIWTLLIDALSAWWSNKKQKDQEIANQAAFVRQQEQEKTHALTEQVLAEEHELGSADLANLLRPPTNRSKPN